MLSVMNKIAKQEHLSNLLLLAVLVVLTLSIVLSASFAAGVLPGASGFTTEAGDTVSDVEGMELSATAVEDNYSAVSTGLMTASQQPEGPASWPGEAGGPDRWAPVTDGDGFVIRNEITGQNQPWLRMSSGEPATGDRGDVATIQVASDGENAFFRQRTLDSPYRFDQGQWQNQGYHLVKIATEEGDSWETQAIVGMHINRDGQVFIEADGDREVIYDGNRDINQADGVQVSPALGGTDGGFWTDVQVPLSEIEQAADIDSDEEIRMFFGTSTQPNSINRDFQDNTGSVTFDNVLTTSFDTLDDDFADANPVSLTSPEPGETVSTTQPTISGTTSPGGGTLEIFVNDELVETIDDVGETWEYELTEEQALADGDHTVRAQLTRDDRDATTETRTFTVDSADPLELTTDELEGWTVEQDGYEQTLTATGGTEPYTFALAEGALPDGLTLSEDGTISGTPTQTGTFEFTVEVTDDADRTVEETFTLRITEQPEFTSPPSLAAGVDGVEYSEQLTLEGGTEPISWEVVAGELPDGLTLDEGTGEITGTPTEPGFSTFTIEGTDQSGATFSKEFTIVITDQLTISSTTLSEWTVDQPDYAASIAVAGGTEPYSFSISDGTLPDGLTLDSDTGEITGEPTEAGTFTFTVLVEDEDETTVERSLSIVINERPTIAEPSELPDGAVGASYSQSLFVTDGTEPFTFDVSEGELPPGLTLDEATGQISGAPEPESAGTYTFTVDVTDSTGATESREYTIEIRDGLTIETTQLDSWTVDQPDFEQTLDVTGGNEPYEWQITAGELPDGLSLDIDTGEITGTPTQIGTYPVTVTVSDATGTEVSQDLTVFINEPVLATSPAELRAGIEGTAYTETLLFEDGTEPVTWTIEDGELPPGLELDAETGEITGTPEAGSGGTYSFTARVTDSAGATDTVETSITISEELAVASTRLSDWTTDQPYNEVIEGVGGTEPYSFSVTDGNLPTGLELNGETGALTGTPTETGTFDFTITIEDDTDETATRTFSVTIAEPVEITSPETLPAGVVGVSYSVELAAEDGTEPIFWELEDGELPPGLTLDADGTLDGVISGVPELADTYEFTISATDAAGSTTERTFTIEITDGLTIETEELDAWTVDQDGYSNNLEVSGGTEPYEWQATGLPDGLSIDSETGEITGTPTQVGTFPVTFTVSDGDGTQVSDQITITVNEELTLESSAELPRAVEGVEYDKQLEVAGGTGAITWNMVEGELPEGLTFDDGLISGTPEAGAAGTYTFTVEAVDESGATTETEFTLVVGDGLTVTTETSLKPWTADSPGYAVGIEVTGGTEPYTWEVTDGALPDGLVLDESTGTITGTPTESGLFDFEVTVTDDDGTQVTQSFTVTIAEPVSMISSETLPAGVEGVSYSEQLTTQDGTEPITWQVEAGELPPGLSLGADGELDGVISGVPELADTYEFTISVTDSAGSTTERTFTIEITDGLALETGELDAWTVGQDGYADNVTVSGGTEPYEWTATGLPDGLDIDPATGEISGTPTETGTFPVSVTVTDADGTQVTRELLFTSNEELDVTVPTELRSGVEGVEYGEQLTSTDGTEPTTWRVKEGTLPPGIELDEDTGELSGQPAADSAGSYAVTVELEDATGATATQTVTIEIGEGLTVTTTELDSWTVDQPSYEQPLSANGGTGPYTWALEEDDDLPAGLTLDEDSGLISGTPEETGSFTFTVEVTDEDGTTVTQELTLTVNEPPEITTDELTEPTAKVAYSEQLTFQDGTGPYTWTIADGDLPAGLSLDPDTGLLSGTPTEAGEFTFTVEVADETAATASQEFTVTVREGLTVEPQDLPAWTVDQDGYDTEIAVSGGTEPYEWDVTAGELPAGLELNETTGELTGEPTEAGTYEFAITVTDADGTQVTQQFTLTVNERLEFTSPDTLSSAVDGVDYSEQITFEDGTGDISWTVTQGDLPDGLTLDTETGVLNGIPTEPGTYEFIVEATDEIGATTQKTFSLTVGDGLSVTTTTLDDWTASQDGYVAALEAAGGTEPYSWEVIEGSFPNGLTLDESSGVITGVPTDSGTYSFTVAVTDDDGTVATQDLILTVNDQPEISSLPELADGVVDVSYDEQLSADAGTAPVSWNVIDGELPPGLTLSADGVLSGLPTASGEYTFTVEAEDAAGATTTQEVVLVIGDVLMVDTTELDVWTVGQDGYDQTIAVSGGTEPYTWAATGLPEGLKLNESTGELTGEPTQTGEFSVTLTVVDADGTEQSHEYTLIVNDELELTTPADLSRAVDGVEYSEQLDLAGGTGPFTWTIADGDLPDGLELNPETGEISGEPTAEGEFTFIVEVTDGTGATATETYTITVEEGLTLTTTTLSEWTVDQPNYSQLLEASGGTLPYTWSADGLPDGLELDESTGIISGEPTETGSFDVTVTVTDGDGTTAEQTLTIHINDEPSQLQPGAIDDPVSGVAYSEQLTVADGTAPVTWEVTDGDLPAGLMLSDDGLLSGTPTEAGEFTFTVEATDIAGATTTREYTVTVGDELTMETADVSDWTVDEGYDQPIEVSGGTEPHTWNVTAGALPPGLELDVDTGELTGTPTAPGTYTFTITVTDGDGTQVARSFIITSNEQPTITSPADLPRAVEDVVYSEPLAYQGGTQPFTWEVVAGDLPDGVTLNEETGELTGTPTTAGEFTFTIEVTDAAGATTTEELTLVVEDGLTVETTVLPEWTVGEAGYSEQLQAAGGTAPYTFEIFDGVLPDGLALDEGTGAITGTPTQAGKFTIEVLVTDADGTERTQEVTLDINGPLELTSPAVLATAVDGVAYSEQLTFEGGTDPQTWSVSSGELPTGLTLDEDTGVLSGIPSEPGTYAFTVEVTDATGATAEETYTVTVGDGLTVSTTKLSEWTVNQPDYSGEIAVAGGTESYSFSISDGALPEGLDLDSGNGEITGEPTESGTFTFTVLVEDEDGTTVEQEYTLVINDQPAIETDTLPDGTEGVSYSHQFDGSDGTAPLTWTVTDGDVPDGLTLSADGLLSGTPTEAGNFTFTVEATDGAGVTTTQEVTLEVTDGLAFETAELPAWTAGVDDYSVSIELTGGTEPYEWSASGISAGLNLNADTGEIAGSPTQTGEFPVTVTVTDADGTERTTTFTLTINEPLESTMSAELPRAVETVEYSEQLPVSGGTGEITWRLLSGELPDGLTFDEETGELSGTPDAGSAGTYTVTVEATDEKTGEVVKQPLILVVGDGLTITTTELDGWTVGQDGYTATIESAGGTGDVTWSVVGDLPAGLALDGSTGELSGEPTDAGTHTITIEATDEDGTTVQRTFTLVIADESEITTPEILPSVPAGVAYDEQLALEGGTGPLSWEVVDGELPPGLELGEDGLLSGTATDAGSYTFTVEVTDVTGATTTAELTIEIAPELALITGTLADWTAGQDDYESVLQAAGGTEPYQWEASGLPDGLAIDSQTGAITGTPEQTGTFTVTVDVTDADGSTATQQLSLAINEQPTITTPETLTSAVDGAVYTEQLTVEGGTGPYSWTVSDGELPPGLSLDETGSITGIPTEAGTYEFTVEVTDGAGDTTQQIITLTVGDGLTLTTTTLTPWTVNQPGYSQTLVPAGGTAPYSFAITDGDLPAGLTLDEETGVLSGEPTESGTFTFDVTVTDADGTEVTETLELAINDAATITSPENLTPGVEDRAYNETLTADDGIGPLTWTVSDGELPPGLSLDAETGVISGTPTAAGDYTATVTATDAAGLTTTETVSITIGEGIAIETGSLDSWTVTQDGYEATLQAVGGTEPYDWQVTGLPDGLTVDSETGQITGTPNQSGTFTVTAQVTDADGSTATQQLQLTINEPLEISSPAELSTGVAGVSYSQQLVADAGTGTVTWELTEGDLPAGVTLENETGQLAGVPEEPGTFTFTVEATDETGATTTQELTITVGDGLTVTTATLSGWTDGQQGYDEQLFAAGGTGPYSWAVTDGDLPDGLALSEDGRLTGTPTETGFFTFTVTITDADGETHEQELTIVVNDQPTVSSPARPEAGDEAVAYSKQLESTEGTGPYTWTVVDGELPPGLTLSETGLLSGTPTSEGTYTFTAQVTDATGSTSTQEQTVEIASSLTITTTTLPDGELNAEYSERLERAGGAAPISWSVIDGTLPPGLSLDAETGELTGTPTTAGTYTFTIRATDDNGITATRHLSLTVSAEDIPDDPTETIEAVPIDAIDPDAELEEQVDDVGGIELVAARLETEPTNSVNATSIIELKNNGTQPQSVIVEHRMNSEVFHAQKAVLEPDQTLPFSASQTLREAGSYRFSFTYVTDDTDGLQTRTIEIDLDTVTIDDDELTEAAETPADDCELIGYDFGGYGLCWYWWVLIDGLIAMGVSYLVQTRIGGVRPLFAASAVGRHLERTWHALPRLFLPWFAGAFISLLVGIVLFTAGVAPAVQVGLMAASAALLGSVMGYFRTPDLAEPLKYTDGRKS